MFIKKSLPYITTICLLQIACNSHKAPNSADAAVIIAQAAEAAPSPATDNITQLIHEADSVVNSIKMKQLEQRSAYMVRVPPNDTLFTHLYFKDNVPVKLSYTTFDETGKASGIAYFYFNDFFSFIHERRFRDEVVYAVVTRDGRYFSFSKADKDNRLKLDETPEAAVDYNLGGFLKYINDLIQLYPDFKFDIPVVKLKGDFALRALAPVPLYEKADTNSRIMGTLKPGTRIGYLAASRERISFRGKRWIWYQVKSGDKIGWVVGHPDWVEEISGEDFD
ncbi:SH3 domain-containing protein [Chitinophaga sp. RAB17]|uniref:SH3 domain-containing protein n=1 Tax=Chitinophaga sp. RAB17 TaxID=3233049 RepID=UPI003F911B5C